MTDQTETTIMRNRTLSYAIYEATVSTDDIVTLEDFDTLDVAVCYKKGDHSLIACTKATNVVTITGAGLTTEPIVIFVMGA